MKKIIITVLLLFLPLLAGAEKKYSTQELLDNLKSPDADKRADAATELGDRRETLGLQALVDAVADKDPKVQMAIVVALGKIGDPRQVTSLCTAVRKTTGAAQKEALHQLTEHYVPSRDTTALKELWDSIGKLFNPPHPVVVEPWIQVDKETIDAIVYVLDDQKSENRIDAAAALGILRADDAIPRLTYYLRSPNEQMVRTCVRSLGYIGNPKAGSSLVPMLKHEDEKIVLDTARVLGQLRYAGALPQLESLLESTKDAELKATTLQAISRIGDPSSEKVMQKYFASKEKNLRQYAIEGFGRMKLQSYLDPLKKEFQREDSRQLKIAYSFSLFSLGETAYIDTIVRGLSDSLYAAQSREYLIELGPAAVPKVAEYLKDPDMELRLSVIRVLGEMHEPEAITYLEPLSKDQNLEIAQTATDAIRELKKTQ